MPVSHLTWSPGHWSVMGADLLRRVGRWWLQQFLTLFPPRFADWLVDRGTKSLVISSRDDDVWVELLTERRRLLASTRVKDADYLPDLIDSFLRRQNLRRTDVTIGIRLPADCVFTRKLLLPLETQRALDAVLIQDLVAKTPFRLDDVYQDHVADRLGERLCVQQWVVRRGFVADALERFGLLPGELGFIEAEASGENVHPHVRLRSISNDHTRWVRGVLATLTLSALLLATLAVSLKYQHQQRTLDALTLELAAARAQAQRVRAMFGKLEAERASLLRLRFRKQGPGLLDVWEETTRLLPSHSWLTELRLSEAPQGQERQVVIVGLSPAAASLVGLIEGSPLFRGAALTGPISIDPSEGKERFAIEAKLKATDPPRTAAR